MAVQKEAVFQSALPHGTAPRGSELRDELNCLPIAVCEFFHPGIFRHERAEKDCMAATGVDNRTSVDGSHRLRGLWAVSKLQPPGGALC